MTLTYHKNKGLISTQPDLLLTFGSDRQSIRTQLQFDPTKHSGRNDNEDNYANVFPDNWLRLSFDGDKLAEIEVLRGSVFVDNNEIKVGGRLDKTIQTLMDKGFNFQKGDYSFTEFNNLFDIGDTSENGGDKNKIAWFYTATNFDHLVD